MYVTCFEPSLRVMAERSLLLTPPLAIVFPFAFSGGQALAQSPLHVDLFFWSDWKR